MTRVISVPPSLDEQSFEQVIEQLADVADDDRILVDARHTRWASPYGLTALLCIPQTRPDRIGFAVPESPDTLSYWSRTGFFRYAAELYEMHGHIPRARPAHESDVLLEVTPISRSEDVHGVVGRIQQKSQEILSGKLHLDAVFTMPFAMTLSEACQNIIEHAGQGGWVAVQTYNYAQRLGRHVVVIAVCDAGIGFRKSLESAPGHRHTDRWNDARALEEAVLSARSRFYSHDSGRGQGLAGIRRFVARWNGKVTVRSGTARIAIAPDWDPDEPMREGLPFFPGAQLQIVIPERIRQETGMAARRVRSAEA